MRPTLGHVTAEAAARVYSGAYASNVRAGRNAIDALDCAGEAVRSFIRVVEDQRGTAPVAGGENAHG